jgi:hypothetical protein
MWWSLLVDHTNYAQWVPGHVGDMVMLADAHRHAHEAFMKSKCNFVGQKSTKIFSLGSKDQSHKQHNKSLQTHSNALGLCESSDALTLFAFAGPYCELMVEEFEAILKLTVISSFASTWHREEHSMRIKFCQDVRSLKQVCLRKQLGNHLLFMNFVTLHKQNNISILLLSSRCIYIASLFIHHTVKKQLEQTTRSLSQPIERSNVLIFQDLRNRSMNCSYSNGT